MRVKSNSPGKKRPSNSYCLPKPNSLYKGVYMFSQNPHQTTINPTGNSSSMVSKLKYIQGDSRAQHQTISDNNSYRLDHYKSSLGFKLNCTQESSIQKSSLQKLISIHPTKNPESRLAGISNLLRTPDKRLTGTPRKTPGGSYGGVKTDFQKFCVRNENHAYSLFKKNQNNTNKGVNSDSLVNIHSGVTGLNKDSSISLASAQKIPVGHVRSNSNSSARLLGIISPPGFKIQEAPTPTMTQSLIKAVDG
jgi:hypothetical protein